MRQSCALLVGVALIASGCTTVPTVVGINGQDSVPLSNREEVHDALGTPVAVGTVNGMRFEEFQVKNGCDQVIWGYRVPAFQPLEEFHIRWGDVRLISVKDASEIPAKGENLVVVAGVQGVLHFRLFDEDGNTVLDTDETKLPAQAVQIAELKKQLESMWTQHKLIDEEKDRITFAVASIVTTVPQGSFEIGVATVKSCGPFMSLFIPPDEDNLSRRRVFRGQILRFEYDNDGKVAKVYLNGEYLISPANKKKSNYFSISILADTQR